MDYKKLSKKAEKRVKDIIKENLSPVMLFHNLKQLKYIIKASDKISDYLELSEDDRFILQVSTCFYGVGMTAISGDYEAAKKLAEDFLTKNDIAQPQIIKTGSMITNAGLGSPPTNPLEEVLHDAITYHYGKKNFLELFELERKEMELRWKLVTPRENWLKEVILNLQQHQYFTVYGRQSLEERKLENIRLVERQLDHLLNPENQDKSSKIPEPEKFRPEKAIDGMFRIAESNSQRLSSMADNKAHILITVNSIILSAVISILLRKLGENRELIAPTVLLLAVSITSMSLSILSTRPSLPGPGSRSGKQDKEIVNPLFFGNFYHMDLESYQAEMHQVMESSALIYNSLIRDIHTEGRVLWRKYKLLRTSYNVFMFGLIASTLAFIVVAVMQPPKLLPPVQANINKTSMLIH